MYAIRSYYEFVKADLKSQAKLQSDNGQYTALIGDKPLNDFIAEWKNADGKNVIIAPTNTGGRITSYNVCYTKLLRLKAKLRKDLRIEDRLKQIYGNPLILNI